MSKKNAELTRFGKITIILGLISALAYLVTIKSDFGMTNSSFGQLIAVLGIYSALVALVALVALMKVKGKRNKVFLAFIILVCVFTASMQLLGAAVINS